MDPIAHVLAVANQKGGVGKTTTAVNLSASLAARSLRVLVIDLDPQGNATTSLGVSPGTSDGTYALFTKEADRRHAPSTTILGNLWLLPANMELSGIDIELAADADRAVRLRESLRELPRDRYDVIVLDCPPSFGLLTLNALAASHSLLVPLQCEFFALEGLAHLKRTVDAVRHAYNARLRIVGIVLTMFDRRTSLSEQVAQDVRGFFGDVVLRTTIPRNIRLSEAPSHGLPIARYDPRSAGAVAYEAMADEMVERLAIQRPRHG